MSVRKPRHHHHHSSPSGNPSSHACLRLAPRVRAIELCWHHQRRHGSRQAPLHHHFHDRHPEGHAANSTGSLIAYRVLRTTFSDTVLTWFTQNLEPHKCSGWEWHGWGLDTLPKPRFHPLQQLLETGYTPGGDQTASADFSG